jgi:hypothetical protein
MNTTLMMIHTTARLSGFNVVVAGGAAADYERATDIDVWVLGSTVKHACKLLAVFGGDESAKVQRVDYGGSYLVGSCQPGWSDKPIQIIATSSEDVTALLTGFDLNVHMWAILPNGQRVGCEHSAEIDQPVRVMNTNGPKTKSRFWKLWKRYFPLRVRRRLRWVQP